MKTPLNVVKERFGDKSKLVAAVEKLATAELWLDRVNDDKGLALVSNTKLLKLHDSLTKVKETFGSRKKLIDAILELEKRTKDDGFRQRLDGFAVPQLLDTHASAKKRAAARAAKPAQTAKKKPARSRKAQAKARAAK